MYKGAAQVHFISAGEYKKSEILYITWLNDVDVIPFITAKSKMYWQGVKSTAYTPKAALFTLCQYILLSATVINGITKTIFNLKLYKDIFSTIYIRLVHFQKLPLPEISSGNGISFRGFGSSPYCQKA